MKKILLYSWIPLVVIVLPFVYGWLTQSPAPSKTNPTPSKESVNSTPVQQSSSTAPVTAKQEIPVKKLETKVLSSGQISTKWQIYSYPNFSIQFPAKPKLIDESTSGKEFKTYFAIQEDGTTYFIEEMDVPPELVATTSRQTLLNAASIAINQAKESADVNVDYAVDTTNEIGYPSVEFSFSISDGPRKFFGQYILLGNKMYQMRVVTTVKSEKAAEFRKFFESFTPKH